LTKLDQRLQPLLAAGRLNEAHEICLQYCQGNRRDVEVWFRLALIRTYLRAYRDAMAAYQHIASLDKDLPEIYFNIGRIYSLHGHYQKALENHHKAIQLDPGFADPYGSIASILRRQGEYDKARVWYQKAMVMQPDFNNLRINLTRQYPVPAEHADAIKRYQCAMRSNLLFMASYHVLSDATETLELHREWDRIAGEDGQRNRYRHSPGGDPERRLRLGYVSPDFRRHSVSYFFEPILAAHDRDRFEVYCYAEVSPGDEVTQRLKVLADGWVTTVGMSDAALAQRIHADHIDILIDLAGHTGGNRLGAFTYKPAPIQATYLGYFTTTGLESMDYWISDEVMTPEDTVEQSTETIWRLGRSCVVYRPPATAPAVAERSADGAVTFGSFSDLSKVSPVAVERWAEILKQVPGSRLLLKAKQLSDEGERRKWQERFVAQGIGAERLELRSRTESLEAHLEMYGEVDIALDSMPRTGGTTTAEALYMGVPVISLAGERFIERLSASMLEAVGLDELVATSSEDYIGKAIELAGDGARRTRLRHDLRGRMEASGLCDAAGLTRSLEQAYAQMWQQYLSGDRCG